MFKSSSRPRAPSVAALRILYQLAYISSGTALGLTALCAEERRRRTAIVQKIADNARRLRQCRRYNAGAAAALLNDVDSEMVQTLRHDAHMAGQERAVLGPELSSVVTREYERTTSRQERVGRRRGDTVTLKAGPFAVEPLETSTIRDGGSSRPRHKPAGVDKRSDDADGGYGRRTAARPWLFDLSAPIHVENLRSTRQQQIHIFQDLKQRSMPYGDELGLHKHESTRAEQKWKHNRSKATEDIDMPHSLSEAVSGESKQKQPLAQMGRPSLAGVGVMEGTSSSKGADGPGLIQRSTDRASTIAPPNEAEQEATNSHRQNPENTSGGELHPSLMPFGGDTLVSCKQSSMQAMHDRPSAVASEVQEQSNTSAINVESIPTFNATDTDPALVALCSTQLSEQQEMSLNVQRLEAQAASLHAEWKKTRNFQRVKARFDSIMQVHQRLQTRTDLAVISLALIQIAFEANQTEVAMTALKAINGYTEAVFSALLGGTLFLADRGDWTSLDTALAKFALTRDTTRQQWTQGDMNVIREIIQLRAKKCDSIQLRDFCLHLLVAHNLVLDRGMTAILLRKFVAEKQLTVLDDWLWKQSSSGQHVILDGPLAAQLMFQLSISFGINHVWLIEQCQDLLNKAPVLECNSLRALLVKAAAFDARHAVGDLFGTSYKEHAKKRMDQLLHGQPVTEVMGGSLGHPGASTADCSNTSPWQRAEADQAAAHTIAQVDAEPAEKQSKSQKQSGLTADVAAPEQSAPGNDNTISITMAEVSEDSGVALPDLQSTAQSESSDKHLLGPSTGASSHRASHELQLLPPMPPNDRTYLPWRVEGQQGVKKFHRLPEPKNASENSSTQRVGSIINLRKVYQSSVPMHNSSKALHSKSRDSMYGKVLRTRMLVAYTDKDYARVLAMYYGSCDPTGQPASIHVLELAIDASMRLHNGDMSEALQICAAAEAAGMNITSSAGPILLNKLRSTPEITELTADVIRQGTIDYYECNSQNGWPSTHALAIAAASRLIYSSFPHYGVSLLEALAETRFVRENPFDIAAMTIWMAGYGHSRSIDGVEHVVNHVLNSSMRIDSKFIRSLQKVRGSFSSHKDQWLGGLEARMDRLCTACIERRAQQKQEATTLSRRLVRILARHAVEPRSRIPEKQRRYASPGPRPWKEKERLRRLSLESRPRKEKHDIAMSGVLRSTSPVAVASAA